MKRKWFFDGIEQAQEELSKKYTHLNCAFQVVSAGLVIEHWKCQNENSEADMMLVTISQISKDKSSVHIYKTEYVQGFPVIPKPATS